VSASQDKEVGVGLVIVLIILALIAGGIGLLVEGLFWLLIIAGILFLAGVVASFVTRRS
jgi:hypothetical protein